MSKTVVLIHGFTDNDLYGHVGSRSQQLWWKTPTFASGKIGSLRLARDGLTPSPLPLFPAVTDVFPGHSVQDYSSLSVLKAALIEAGYNVYFFGFDWRLPMQIAAQQLANILRNTYVPDSQHFSVVGHSMGGLVARFAYHLSPDTVRAIWDKTVYICTPHGGSYMATQSLCHPESMFLNPTSPFYSMAQAAKLFFNISEAVAVVIRFFQSVLSTFPAAYELMPNVVDNSPWPDPRGLSVLMDTRNCQLADPFWSAEKMSAAFSNMHMLNQLASEARATDVCVVGTETPTPSGFVAVDGVVDFDLYLKASGDGVVTAARQTLPGTRLIELSGLQHSLAPRDPRLILDLPTWIDGSDTVAASVPQPQYFDPNLQLQGAVPPVIQSTWTPPNLALPTKQDP